MTDDAAVDRTLRNQHISEVGNLPDDELLALAYSFAQNPQRLRHYLELFRTRAGARAQLAACLLCYDLARRGDSAMGAQFGYLQSTLLALSKDETLVAHLLGDHAYLCETWSQCKAFLATNGSEASQDAPGEAESWGHLRAADAPLAGELNLLSDLDVPELDTHVDMEAMWQTYVRGCEAFFGSGIERASYDSSMGFKLRGHHGQARAQAFLQVLDSCEKFVAPARGIRPLLLLAWGLSLKPRGLLGQPNKRRQHLLTQGLEALIASGAEMAEVAHVMGPLYADATTWRDIVDLSLGYYVWSQRRPGLPTRAASTITHYIEGLMPQ